MAFHRGEDSDEAMVGALLLASGLDCLRTLKGFLVGLSKGAGRRG